MASCACSPRFSLVLLAAVALQAPQEPVSDAAAVRRVAAGADGRGPRARLQRRRSSNRRSAASSRFRASSRTTAHRLSWSSASTATTRVRVTPAVVRRGRELAREYRTVLGRIESAYDVQRRFIMAIWGIETRYGRVTGNTPVFQALATLAWEPRRSEFFRGELFDALTMVSKGYIDTRTMTGSWAGAMGHPQFMPSSYLKFAEDFDHDGRRDIWRLDTRRARVNCQLPAGLGLGRRASPGDAKCGCRRKHGRVSTRRRQRGPKAVSRCAT